MTDMGATPVTAYGNSPTGEHPAVFVGARVINYPAGKRFIYLFLILDADGEIPLTNNLGESYYAVAVCNVPKGNNPKSKSYKIRKAMLLSDEYDPIGAAVGMQEWQHFAYSKDEPKRVLWIRVEHRGEITAHVSVVTHIKRPRDGVWEGIEGEFEGVSKPVNLHSLFDEQFSKCPESKKRHYGNIPFNLFKERYSWIDEHGNFVTLSEEEEASLTEHEGKNYKAVRKFADSGKLWDLGREPGSI